MDQISPPMRIALAVALVFLAAWMLVLKPKDGNVAPLKKGAPQFQPTADNPNVPATASATDANQAQTSLGKAVEGARGAAAATEATQDKEAAASGEAPTATKPGVSAAAKPSVTAAPAKPTDPALAALPTWLRTNIDHKVVAILFTDRKAADDRRTKAALQHAFTAHGQVVKRAVPLSQIAKYRPVAQGVDVDQSPTLMVIDKQRHAQTLVGYSSTDAINQAIVDGLLATAKPVREVPFLSTVKHACRSVNQQVAVGPTSGASPQGYRENVDAALGAVGASLGIIRNAPAPAAYKPARASALKYLTAQRSMLQQVRGQAIGAKRVDAVKVRAITAKAYAGLGTPMLELNAVGIGSCN